MRGHQDRCMIRNEVSDSLKNGYQTRYQDVVLSHQRSRHVLGGFFNLTITISKLGVQPEEVSKALQLAERDKHQGRLGRSAVSMDVVAPQMFPLLSVMALIKLQLVLSPCLLVPLQCCMTGASEAVVRGAQ